MTPKIDDKTQIISIKRQQNAKKIAFNITIKSKIRLIVMVNIEEGTAAGIKQSTTVDAFVDFFDKRRNGPSEEKLVTIPNSRRRFVTDLVCTIFNSIITVQKCIH